MVNQIYASTSPYYNTPQTSFSLDLWQGIDILAYDTDKMLLLPKLYEFRPDLLSYDLYQTTRLWWVFSVRNPDVIKDPIYDFIEGYQIYVTDKETLFSILNI